MHIKNDSIWSNKDIFEAYGNSVAVVFDYIPAVPSQSMETTGMMNTP